MNPRLALAYTIFILACCAARAGAAVPPSFSFQVARAPHALALDPSMRDTAWQAGKVPSPASWENVTTRAPAAENTNVYFLFDDSRLYVGFVVQQPSAPIVATQTANDVGFGTDDFVGIGVDSSGAGTQAYLFETTPRGVRYQQATENVRFRPNWQSASTIEGNAWRAVMVIPLNAMRLRRGAIQTWRIGFFRNIAARGEHLSWAYDPNMPDAIAGSWPSFNDLRFWPSASGVVVKTAAGIAPKPRLEVYGLPATEPIATAINKEMARFKKRAVAAASRRKGAQSCDSVSHSYEKRRSLRELWFALGVRDVEPFDREVRPAHRR